MKTVLVTGGAGYVGSHCCLSLLDNGYKVLVLDDLSTGSLEIVPGKAVFIKGDAGDSSLLQKLFSEHEIDAVLHCAGSSIISESVSNPEKFYKNNTENTKILLQEVIKAKIPHFVFSSTASVYGIPEILPISENSELNPISPYGKSKLMSENILCDLAETNKWFSYSILRYFNVAGADAKLRSGQTEVNSTYLIKTALEVALGKRSHISIFGTDYPTYDGTCVRDYIHVSDLADAHMLVLNHLFSGNGNITLNAGYGRGTSVKDIISAVRKVSGVDIKTIISKQRVGDPPILIADPTKLFTLGWKPKFDDIVKIIESAYLWEKNLKYR